MTPEELRAAGRELYGYGWQTRIAEDLKIDGSTVRRWVSGAVPIPGPAQAAIECWLERKRENS
jgi:hypothetical protein